MNPVEALAEFMLKFEASLDPRLWVNLVKEENAEFEEAHAIMCRPVSQQADMSDEARVGRLADCLKEAADVIYVSTGLSLLLEESENLYRFLIDDEEWADWEATIHRANRNLKVAKGIFGTYSLGEAFSRVHQSNLSKLGDDGKPARREDGKILKGPNYRPPFLTDLVQ